MTRDFQIRVAVEADIGALDHLFRRSYSQLLVADYPPSVLISAIPVMARAQPELVNSGLFYVAERAGRIIGAGGWSLRPPGGKPGLRGVGHVRHVASDPGAVRQGVARALVSHIQSVAKASGMVQMHCLSTLTAVPFYEAMGFVSQGSVSVGLRGGVAFPAVQMSAHLWPL